MKRKTSIVPTRVFKYGLQLPTGSGRLVDEAMYLGHKFYNQLIELERARRAAYRAERTRQFPVLVPLEAEEQALSLALDKARDALTAIKIASRTRLVDEAGEAEVVRLKQALKVVRERLHEEREACLSPEERAVRDKLRLLKGEKADTTILRKVFKEEMLRAREATPFGRYVIALDAEYAVKVANARKGSGLAWGTYNMIVASVQQASKSSSSDPEFQHYDGEGRIGVQIQGGMSVAELATDTQLQIAMPQFHDGMTRSEWRKASRTVVKMRVGSDEKKRPIWAEFPAVIHRPLPDDARIMGAVITRRRLGVFRRWSYDLCISCESNLFDSVVASSEQKGTAAINFGWRQFQDGLRVAMVSNDVTGIEEIRLPNKIIQRFTKCDDLVEIIDKSFNAVRIELSKWFVKHKSDCPEWLVKALEFLHAWHQPERLDRVVGNWGAGLRFPADVDIFPVLAEWRVKWRHLEEWMRRNRRQGLNMRKDFYRTTAARLARTSSRMVIEHFDIRQVAVLPKPEVRKTGGDAAGHNRFLASISELRGCLLLAAAKYHCAVDIVSATNNTRRCNVCGKLLDWDPAMKVDRDCPDCSTWDQDVNATDNAMTRVASGEVVPMVVPAEMAENGEIAPATRRTFGGAREALDNQPCRNASPGAEILG